MEGTLTSGKTVTASENILCAMYESTSSLSAAMTMKPTNDWNVACVMTVPGNGSVRVAVSAKQGHSYYSYILFRLYRGTSIIESSTEIKSTNKYNYVTHSYDFKNVKVGDVVKVLFGKSEMNYDSVPTGYSVVQNFWLKGTLL